MARAVDVHKVSKNLVNAVTNALCPILGFEVAAGKRFFTADNHCPTTDIVSSPGTDGIPNPFGFMLRMLDAMHCNGGLFLVDRLPGF